MSYENFYYESLKKMFFEFYESALAQWVKKR